jgi:hypothetical protein
MAVVLGLLADRGQALAIIEALRYQRFELDHVRLVGGSDTTDSLASETGPGTVVASGPANAVVGGLLQGSVSEDQLRALTSRLDQGGVAVLGEDLDDTAADQLTNLLRQHGAEVTRAESGVAHDENPPRSGR